MVALLPNLEADRPIPLPGASANKVGFSWFPDSARIVVALSTSKGSHGLIIYRADDPTGQPLPLFASTGFAVAPENPEVSPDGSKVVFEAWKMEGPENREPMGLAILSTDISQSFILKNASDMKKLNLVVPGD